MKINFNHPGKLYEFEIQKNYQVHLNRMNRIAAKRKSLIRDHSNLSSNIQKSPTSNLNNGFKNQQQRRQHQQNIRLMRKLSQIQNRKSNFVIENQEQKYYTLNVKYRQAIRKKKEQQIQQENNNMVERIVQRLSRQKSNKDILASNADIAFELQRSRHKARKIKYKHKRNKSVMLPHLQVPNIPKIDLNYASVLGSYQQNNSTKQESEEIKKKQQEALIKYLNGQSQQQIKSP